MTSEPRTDSVEQNQPENTEGRVARRSGVLGLVLRGLLWPLNTAVRAYRGFWRMLFTREPQAQLTSPDATSPTAPSPPRHNLIGRKRIRRVTRLLLAVLPRWAQGALGYPVSSSIGLSLSPEVRVSPTKPCGKGSKRKQDELEEEDEEEEHPTWVEALSQELAEDEDPEEDPDYEPSSVETESEEYASQNNTESDIEVPGGGIVIEDVNTTDAPSTLTEGSGPAV
ncbi:oogenesis-related [Menidia menidia]